MQVKPQPLCGSSAHLPLLEGNPVEGPSQHQGVLQKHRAERSYKSHNVTAPPRRQRGSLSPSENAYAQQCVTTGTYYTGNVHAQHIGLAGFVVGRSEKQIRCELGRLYKLLQRSEKYQAYREKQPALTPAEVITRDAAERKEQERRKAEGLQQEKDKTVWPDFIEHAFWTALVRWPPMGRKKYMLEGTQRGRNELIQDSIHRDTGIRRDRKQISSHLQVLKQKLRAVPAVLLYMATPEDVTKRRCASAPIRTCHSSHMRGRQHAQRTDSVAKYEYNMASPHVWPHLVDPHQDLALGFGPEIRSLSSLFTLTDLSLVVDGDDQPVHCSIEAHSNSKLDEWDIADLASWHHQYPEFGFLRSETDDWMRNGRNVLVCTAPIKLMAEVRLEADLTIAFDLYSHLDLSRYEYMECMTRFYDDGQDFVDSELDSMTHDGKEHRTSCEYRPDSYGSKGVLRVKFDAAFWLTWMKRCGNMSYRDDRNVQNPRLTAVQDIYGIIPGTNEAQCLCTVLWRSQRTRSSAEADSMKWRPFNFVKNRSAAEARWCDEAEDYHEDLGDVEGEHGQVTDVPTSTPTNVMSYYQTPQLPPDLVQTHTSNHSHEIESHHERHPPPLSIDILGSMQSDLDHLDSSAATTTTGFSQQSFALPRNQATLSSSAHDSDFDFSDGHMTTNDVFEPAINISAYGSFLSQDAGLKGLHSLAGLEHDEFAAMGLAIGEHGQLVPVNANDLQTPPDLACFPIKPNWQHLHLISHLEHAAEQYGPYINPCEFTKPTQDHENLHGHDVYQRINQREESVATGLHGVHAQAGHSLWDLQGLQRSFEERTSSWMHHQKEQAHISEFGVPDLIEKNQRDKGY